MNTKIDLNNLEYENIVNIAARLGVLSEDSGAAFMWFCDTISAPTAKTFSSEENAKEYGILRN